MFGPIQDAIGIYRPFTAAAAFWLDMALQTHSVNVGVPWNLDSIWH